METNPSSSSSSSSSSPAKKYDVFLSFRGDTRNSFTSHLDYALRKVGVFSIFKDDYKLPKGKGIQTELMKAIEDSHFAVVVISEKYADSDWCLKELAKIVKCMGDSGRIRTIFYHVNPSHVRDVVSTDAKKQKDNSFWKALDQHAKNHVKDPSRFEYSESWRSALVKVSYEYADYVKAHTDEAIFIKKFVADISTKLGASIRTIDGLFGMPSRLRKLNSYVHHSLDTNDVCFIGIHGMGGIGKSTFAEAYHMKTSHKFDGSCFLANIREVCEKQANGLVSLQKKLLKVILGEELQVEHLRNGINLIRSRLRAMKVLIILDDINNPKQLEALVDSHKKKQGLENELDIWFGGGSVIIVTTRNENLLTERYEKCRAEYLDDNEALQLFSWKAFESIEPPEEFKELSKEVVKYASNLPLALTVLGSLLRPNKKHLWESALCRLRKCPEKEIIGILKISFDDLDEVDQCIFLDIACCFRGYNETEVIEILDSCGFNSKYGISNLIAKSLLSIIEHGRIWMHDLLEEMAKDVVRKESGYELARQRRIWNKDDLYQILVNKEGTNDVETIATDVDETKEYTFEALSSMKKLRILSINANRRTYFDGQGLDFDDCVGPELPNNLRYLCWRRFPYDKFPSSFQPHQLVQLSLRDSDIKQLWNNFAVVPNLRILYLCGCEKLSEIHPSIEHLKSLIRLDLMFCESLKELPEEINGLASLQSLNIVGCSKIKNLPDNLEKLKSLRKLEIKDSGIKHLPSSIFLMENLESAFCEGEMIASAVAENIISYRTTGKCFISCWFFDYLSRLDLIDCNLTGPEAFPEYFGKLASLEYLDLSKNPFSVLPPCINGLSGLKTLRLEHCKSLRCLEAELLPSSLKEIYVDYCTSLDSFLDPLKPCHLRCSIVSCLDCTELVKWQDGKMTALASLTRFLQDTYRSSINFEFVVPQSDYALPSWFINQSSTASISIKLDPNCRNRVLIGFAMVFCFRANSSEEDNFSYNIRGRVNDEHRSPCGPWGVRLVYEEDKEDLKEITSKYYNDQSTHQKDVQSSHSQSWMGRICGSDLTNMDSYVQIFTNNEMHSANVTIKSFLNSTVNTIKKKFSMKDAVKRGKQHSSLSAYTPATSKSQSLPIASPVDAATPKAYCRHSAPSPRTATDGTSVETKLCAMEEKLFIMDDGISSMDSKLSSMDSRLSSMDSKQSSMDSRLSSMDSRQSSIDSRQSSIDSRLSSIESKLDYLIKLFSSTYNTTGVQLDEDDVQHFDEVGGEGTCDQRIDYATNHLVPPVSISSSPIVESEHNVKVFTQMSDRRLASSRRKMEAAKTIESPYDYQSLHRRMIHTLPVSGSITFDPYRPVPDKVARQYVHFMDTSTNDQTMELFWITVGKDYFTDIECSPNWLTSDHMETVTHLIRQRADKYPEVFDSRILLLDNRLSQYMEIRLDFFNENKKNYDFGEEMLEFLNGKEPMMKIKPCWEYDRVLLPLNRDNNHWLLGDIDLCTRHMMLYDCRMYGQTDQSYQVKYYQRLMPMLPYILRAAGFFKYRHEISDSMDEFKISLAPDCPQQKKE
ncbi:hypothetical protein FNV43_RR08382 [Rhamnella rubrinervis]|uniref:ADP-ribosyl cyclase/cyclic ADP-ribose hydrolase n=1 Tax=Rhamnella rubrinervis TaxID=2594499 RepID=A0A8K0MIQ0_9ROSA|nr:hypothetical protein FNV43_RR08382 [Rhamnella rubrinervis]